MRSLAFDLRDALRSFRHDRAYTLTVIVTLALTIGATTTVFSIVNGVLLTPLAYDRRTGSSRCASAGARRGISPSQ